MVVISYQCLLTWLKPATGCGQDLSPLDAVWKPRAGQPNMCPLQVAAMSPRCAEPLSALRFWGGPYLGWTLFVSGKAVRTNLRPCRSSRALAMPLQLAATWAYSSRKMGSTSTPAAHAITGRVECMGINFYFIHALWALPCCVLSGSAGATR